MTALHNCRVTIEPKGHPEENRIFWNAEIGIDESPFYGNRKPDAGLDGFEIPISMKIYPGQSINDKTFNIGIIGQNPETWRKADKIAVIKKRMAFYLENVKEAGETHPEVFVMLGDLREAVKMLEDKGGAE